MCLCEYVYHYLYICLNVRGCVYIHMHYISVFSFDLFILKLLFCFFCLFVLFFVFLVYPFLSFSFCPEGPQ